MNEKIFLELIKLSKKASKKDEVPIAAIITYNDKIIAKAYNKRNKTNNITNHAEIIVIQKASHKLKTWHLASCNLYVTLKPCPMCSEAIRQSRIDNVYYLLEKPKNKKEYSKTNFIKANVYTTERDYSNILTAFFKKKRDK